MSRDPQEHREPVVGELTGVGRDHQDEAVAPEPRAASPEAVDDPDRTPEAPPATPPASPAASEGILPGSLPGSLPTGVDPVEPGSISSRILGVLLSCTRVLGHAVTRAHWRAAYESLYGSVPTHFGWHLAGLVRRGLAVPVGGYYRYAEYAHHAYPVPASPPDALPEVLCDIVTSHFQQTGEVMTTWEAVTAVKARGLGPYGKNHVANTLARLARSKSRGVEKAVTPRLQRLVVPSATGLSANRWAPAGVDVHAIRGASPHTGLAAALGAAVGAVEEALDRPVSAFDLKVWVAAHHTSEPAAARLAGKSLAHVLETIRPAMPALGPTGTPARRTASLSVRPVSNPFTCARGAPARFTARNDAGEPASAARTAALGGDRDEIPDPDTRAGAGLLGLLADLAYVYRPEAELSGVAALRHVGGRERGEEALAFADLRVEALLRAVRAGIFTRVPGGIPAGIDAGAYHGSSSSRLVTDGVERLLAGHELLLGWIEAGKARSRQDYYARRKQLAAEAFDLKALEALVTGPRPDRAPADPDTDTGIPDRHVSLKRAAKHLLCVGRAGLVRPRELGPLGRAATTATGLST